ncbi:M17 family metallopeptidase [Shewanella sp. WPAGA9]|uniref:M17 family metallopeptidase n=1 Tax=Shewanella sp. ENK2 TaxID=2775245 RepID=UPI00177FED1B|nr:leucyl aminopeptidase family protein [Shewanella sp. WPAGA9]
MLQANVVDVKNEDAIFEGQGWDAVIVITTDLNDIKQDEIKLLASHGKQIDNRIGQSATLLFAPGLAGGRLIISPVSAASNEYSDVTVFAKAAREGLAIAKSAGAVKPLLVVNQQNQSRYQYAQQVSALACGQELWQSLELREVTQAEGQSIQASVTEIGLLTSQSEGHSFSDLINAVEAGKILTRDLCGTEPERMAAPAFADYCVDAFTGSGLSVSVIEEQEELERDYPLLCAVGRASFSVQRHQPRVVKVEYVGEGTIEKTLFFAGKGVIYDTGGADIKVAGGMAGMSRDKGGAAVVAGLMKTLSILKPKGLRVVAELGLVRNSIGSNAFVPDEIIKSHAGVRVRIGNTDAEGRLVLADLLSHLRIKATTAVNPQLFSVATLTGHVVRCYGGYTAVVENAVAKKVGISQDLEQISALWGESFEVSRLRSDDFNKVNNISGEGELLSSNNGPSAITARGHQYPAAFLINAAGLDNHGLNSSQPMPFAHIDIAGSATEGHPLYGKPTGEPLVTLLHNAIK